MYICMLYTYILYSTHQSFSESVNWLSNAMKRKREEVCFVENLRAFTMKESLDMAWQVRAMSQNKLQTNRVYLRHEMLWLNFTAVNKIRAIRISFYLNIYVIPFNKNNLPFSTQLNSFCNDQFLYIRLSFLDAIFFLYFTMYVFVYEKFSLDTLYMYILHTCNPTMQHVTWNRKSQEEHKAHVEI